MKVFNLFDDDQTGRITLRNLKRVAKELARPCRTRLFMEMIERADNGPGRRMLRQTRTYVHHDEEDGT